MKKIDNETGSIFLMSVLFVFLWSSGYVAAKASLPYIGPLTVLLYRYAIVAVVLFIFSLFTKAPWPRDWRNIIHLSVVSISIHVLYLGCVFVSIDLGVTAGIVTLITSMQPILTALIASQLLGKKERVNALQWTGVSLGICGVAIVIQDTLHVGGSLLGYLFAFGATIFITVGTLYQKKYCGEINLGSGMCIQYIVATGTLALVTPFLETMQVNWNGELIFVLLWLVLMCSLGSYMLLFYLVKLRSATKTTSLIYLTPPVVMFMAYFIFGENIRGLGLVGTAITVLGVAMINSPNLFKWMWSKVIGN